MKDTEIKKEGSYKIIHYEITLLDTALTLQKKLSNISQDASENICVILEYSDNAIISPKLFDAMTSINMIQHAINFMTWKLHGARVSRENILYKYEKLVDKKRKDLIVTVEKVIKHLNELRVFGGFKGKVKYFLIPVISHKV